MTLRVHRALLLGPLLAMLAASAGRAASITATPAVGRPGESLSVTAKGLRPGAKGSATLSGGPRASFSVDVNGRAITVLSLRPSVRTGRHRLTVRAGGRRVSTLLTVASGEQAASTLVALPGGQRLFVAPPEGDPGARFRLRASGLRRQVRVTLRFDTTTIGTYRTNGHRAFAGTAVIPAMAAGIHELRLDGGGTRMSMDFLITSPPAPPPAPAPAPGPPLAPPISPAPAPAPTLPAPAPPAPAPPAPPKPPPAPSAPITVTAAGDIACDPANPLFNSGLGGPNACAQKRTSDLLMPADAIFSLGDNQYEQGTEQQFAAGFNPTWGRFKPLIFPVPGNHEYLTPGATGYYAYFRDRAGNPTQGWYSFDLGAWHILALNSECDSLPAGTCDSGGAQETFVRQDLAAHPAACTLAMWHEPHFFSGTNVPVPNAPAMTAIWTDLANAHVDVVLSAHKHYYERYELLNAAGALDNVHGIQQFVSGAGGEEHGGDIAPLNPHSVVHDNTTFGVLKLTLRPGSYNWQFLHEAGRTFTDSGTRNCR